MGYKGWENFKPGQNSAAHLHHQQQGRRSRELGQAFEDRINMVCDYYRTHGMAYIEKTPEPFKVTDRQYDKHGKFIGFTGHFEKQAQPDYKGTLRGGRAVCFEAKVTEAGRIMQDAVTDWQAAALEQHQQFGAEVFVMVSLNLRSFYRVPWVTWKLMKHIYGHKFMTAEELEKYRITDRGTGMVHFLEENKNV